jgi:hypothetical protein
MSVSKPPRQKVLQFDSNFHNMFGSGKCTHSAKIEGSTALHPLCLANRSLRVLKAPDTGRNGLLRDLLMDLLCKIHISSDFVFDWGALYRFFFSEKTFSRMTGIRSVTPMNRHILTENRSSPGNSPLIPLKELRAPIQDDLVAKGSCATCRRSHDATCISSVLR